MDSSLSSHRFSPLHLAHSEKSTYRSPVTVQSMGVHLCSGPYKDSDVIICKEVKSALDNQTEQKIVKKVGQMHGIQPRFLIAHRLTGLKNVTVYSG